MSGFVVNQDCAEFPNQAAEAEVSEFNYSGAPNIELIIAMAYWYGVCTSHDSSSGGTLLDPVFISTNNENEIKDISFYFWTLCFKY